ncbi:MAG: Coagulase/fibrinolysin precursor [Syntrophaceae bacterium PtaU1.Bin231]|nr:MAG: Coagulase/fibrinolysin precursor [Syntrophaceae bacterium PtaU1.Bin231]
MKIGKRWLTAVCLILMVPNVYAQDVDKGRTEKVRISDKISIEIYGGYLKGESRELVYNAATGVKESELFWSIDEAYVLGGTLAVRPLEWLTFRAGGWTPIKANNTMDDYDWLTSGETDWTHHSNHPDTKLNRARQIDVSVAARLVKFRKTSWFESAQVDFLAGYRWLYMNWTASGGTFISSDGGFRNRYETFQDGMAVIGYEQWIETPYAGLGGSIAFGRWSFAGELTGSLWGKASDRDNHYLRTLLFEDTFTNVPMIAGEFMAGYAVTSHLSLFGSFMYQRYFETKGPTTMTNYAAGQSTYFSGDAAGIAHYSMLVSLGLKWIF